jgi:hypothetical protein
MPGYHDGDTGTTNFPHKNIWQAEETFMLNVSPIAGPNKLVAWLIVCTIAFRAVQSRAVGEVISTPRLFTQLFPNASYWSHHACHAFSCHAAHEYARPAWFAFLWEPLVLPRSAQRWGVAPNPLKGMGDCAGMGRMVQLHGTQVQA